MIKTTVAILAKNEEENISAVVSSALPYCSELLVIDGKSSDETATRAAAAGARLILDQGAGKGDGVRKAISSASGEILVLMDGDGSHDARDIPLLIKPIEDDEADLVIASRLRGGSDEFHGTLGNILRLIGVSLITWFIAKRWGIQISDSQNGFRAVRTDSVIKLGLSADDFTIEQEMVIKAVKHKLRIQEIPSHESARKAGMTKLSTIQGWKFVWHLIKEAFK